MIPARIIAITVINTRVIERYIRCLFCSVKSLSRDMKQIDVIVNENEETILPVIWIDGVFYEWKQASLVNASENSEEITLHAKLGGKNASLLVVGIFLGKKYNSVKFDTDITHVGLHTKSLTTIRAVFLDHSSFNNEGMVRIHKGAKDTNGSFQSKVLLFDDARGRSVPSLEIDENEVKAGHGSTIGRPEAEQLFYMQSRGMSETEAERLIISGFFEPVIALLGKEEQNKVREQLEKHLEII